MSERDKVIKHHLEELKEKVLKDGNIRDFDMRNSDFISDVILYQCMEWCLNKSIEEIKQRELEMIERILSATLQKVDDIFRLATDRCMLATLRMVQEFDKK